MDSCTRKICFVPNYDTQRYNTTHHAELNAEHIYMSFVFVQNVSSVGIFLVLWGVFVIVLNENADCCRAAFLLAMAHCPSNLLSGGGAILFIILKS